MSCICPECNVPIGFDLSSLLQCYLFYLNQFAGPLTQLDEVRPVHFNEILIIRGLCIISRR